MTTVHTNMAAFAMSFRLAWSWQKCSHTGRGTIHRKYVLISKERRELRKDRDELISDASEELLDELSSMSLECMGVDQYERPSAFKIMVRLQEMTMKARCGDNWTRTDSCVTGGERCSICHKQATLGLSCSDHFICADDLRSHRGIDSGGPLECMMEGCSKCYRHDDVQKCLPSALYKQYVDRQDLNVTYMPMLEKIYEIAKRLDGKFDVALEDIRHLQTASDRALVALAYLATGEQTPCPKLVWIIPQKRIKTKRMDFFKDAFFQETAVYFLCEKTFEKGHEAPIIMNFGRDWVKHLLPLVKLSLLTLKLAGAVTTGLPFPIPGLGQWDQFQLLEDVLKHEDSIRETLEDMDVWLHEIVEKGESLMEGPRVARFKALIGSSYEMLSQKALKEENLPKWRKSMTTELVYDDHGKECKIKWVKL
jgi:hypothetical protein